MPLSVLGIYVVTGFNFLVLAVKLLNLKDVFTILCAAGNRTLDKIVKGDGFYRL